MVKEKGIWNSFQKTTLEDFSFSLDTLNIESYMLKKSMFFYSKEAKRASFESLVGFEYKKQLSFLL